MYTKRIQLTNYGPIDRVDIVCPFDGDKPKPVVLVGRNGSGKSIVLSHIVNGLLLAQQVAYPETPQVATNRVYKLRSPSYVKSGCEFSAARISFENDAHVEELQLAKRKQDTPNVPPNILEASIQELWSRIPSSGNSVLSFPGLDKERVGELFGRNCILYFPSNRFEEPAWLNEENLNAKARHMDIRHMEGHTERTVINYSPLRDNENWLFDVVYDFSVFELQTSQITIPLERPDKSKLNVPLPLFLGYSGRAKAIYDIALRVVQAITRSPTARFGIGPRNRRAISLMENEKVRVPNVFQLSSGEVSLLNLFLSILRDFDLCGAPFAKAEDVRGIVVVDEVDLHLHMVHQYEILPKLIQMFPRVQFVLTTHSPLFVLGLQNTLTDGGFGLYRLPDGQEIAPEEFGEFGGAYQAFRRTVTHTAEIDAAVKGATKPLVLVDGTTDIKYIGRAAALLGWRDTLTDIDFRDCGGEGNLKHIWKVLTTADVVQQAVVLLHDCESSVSSCGSGNVFRQKAPLVEGHPILRGIENLFSKETLKRAVAHKPAFIDIIAEHETTERGQRRTIPEQWKVNRDEKTNLCNWLCENGTVEDFRHFDNILDVLRRVPGMLRPPATDRVDDGPSQKRASSTER